MELQQPEWQPVVHRADPAGVGQGRALRVRDRHHRHVHELAIEGLELGDVQPPVQGGDVGGRQTPHHGEVHVRQVEVDDIELVRPLGHLFEHQEMWRQIIPARAPEAQGARAHRHELRARRRIAAREERHGVSLADRARPSGTRPLARCRRKAPVARSRSGAQPGRYAYVALKRSSCRRRMARRWPAQWLPSGEGRRSSGHDGAPSG